MSYTLQQTTLIYAMTTTFCVGLVVSSLGYMPLHQMELSWMKLSGVIGIGMAGIVIGNVIKDQLQ